MKFSASTLRHRTSIVRSQKSHLFYSFLLKTPQKHTLCVNFIRFITSVIISNPRSVFVLSLEIPLSSLDFLLTYSQKITFYDIFCLKCPKIVFYGNSGPASIKNIAQHHSKYICTKFHPFCTKCTIFVLAAPLLTEGIVFA